MAEHRVYLVGPDDHFKAVETIHCDTDDEAVDTAIAGIRDSAAVEVWCGGRSLGRIAPQEA